MGHRKSLTKQVQETLQSMMAIGQSRKAAKQSKTAYEHIYSTATYKTYLKQGIAFTDWCKASHGCKTLDECKAYAQEYIDECKERGDSAYSIKTYAAALRKIYMDKGMALETPKRDHRAIKRSRGEKMSDEHFSEAKNADLISFCKGTGLRRRELETITGKSLQEDGTIRVQGKGGKWRNVTITGPDAEAIRERIKAAGDNKVFGPVHTNADIHSYRREYAQSLYNERARDTEDLPHNEIYYTRDGTHRRYDKAALLYVSQQLGHNRESVTAVHYVR